MDSPTIRRIPPGIAAMNDDQLALFIAQALVDSTVSEAARARALEHGLNAREQRERAHGTR